MDETRAFFDAVGHGDAGEVSRMIAEKPELARCRAADSLSVLQFARYMDQGAILGLLVDAGPPLDIFEAATIDRADVVAARLDEDASLVTALSPDGFSAAHFAAYFGALAALGELLDRGAGTEILTQNFLANRPLHAAAAGGHLEACKLLLVRGADPNAPQHHGHRPLHTAAFRADRTMAQLFISHGADAALMNDDGKTPAQVAGENGHMELLAALLRLHEA